MVGIFVVIIFNISIVYRFYGYEYINHLCGLLKNLGQWNITSKCSRNIARGFNENYHQTSNISRTLEGDKIVDHSDVFVASPVGAAPTILYSRLNTWLQWFGQGQLQDGRETFKFRDLVRLI